MNERKTFRYVSLKAIGADVHFRTAGPAEEEHRPFELAPFSDGKLPSPGMIGYFVADRADGWSPFIVVESVENQIAAIFPQFRFNDDGTISFGADNMVESDVKNIVACIDSCLRFGDRDSCLRFGDRNSCTCSLSRNMEQCRCGSDKRNVQAFNDKFVEAKSDVEYEIINLHYPAPYPACHYIYLEFPFNATYMKENLIQLPWDKETRDEYRNFFSKV